MDARLRLSAQNSRLSKPLGSQRTLFWYVWISKTPTTRTSGQGPKHLSTQLDQTSSPSHKRTAPTPPTGVMSTCETQALTLASLRLQRQLRGDPKGAP